MQQRDQNAPRAVARRQRSAGAIEVTSRDVADALGISQSTVSRAFTPGASISPALRERIHATAARLGYRPNLIARSLNAGESKLVGFVLSRQTNLIYPELVYELSGGLSERGYQLLLFTVPDDGDVTKTVERIWSYRVDAVLSTGVLDERQAQLFEPHALPLVMLNRVLNLPVSSVSCDFAGGAAGLVQRLLETGHRRFVLVAGPETSFVSAEVEAGVRRGLARAAGASLDVIAAEYQYECGRDAIARLAGEPEGLPDAVVCVNDTVAAGCLDQLRGPLGKNAPKDLSLVAFEGFGPATWESYQITGMRQPMAEMTASAIDVLLARIGHPERSVERRSFLPIFVPGATARL